MSKRIRVRTGKDKKVFSNTADKTKRINIAPTVMRGGTRL